MKDLRQIRLIPIKIHPRESKVQKTLRQIRLIPIKIYARESKAQKTYPECYTYFFHPCGIKKVHKIDNFFGSEFEFYTISLLVKLKY